MSVLQRHDLVIQPNLLLLGPESTHFLTLTAVYSPQSFFKWGLKREVELEELEGLATAKGKLIFLYDWKKMII